MPMLWSCSTWSFMIATSGVTTIILGTAFLCNALINLGKSWKIKLFPNPVGRMAMRPLPRNTFWRQSFYSICKLSTFGKSSSACRTVIQPCVTPAMEDDLRTQARHIAFLVCVNNPLVLTGGVKFGQSEGIPDSGIPPWAFLKLISQAFPRPPPQSPLVFFPLFRSLSFSLALQYLNVWNRLLSYAI